MKARSLGSPDASAASATPDRRHEAAALVGSPDQTNVSSVPPWLSLPIWNCDDV